MTRPSKKEHEKRLASCFLEGFDHVALDEDEQTDFRIRRPQGDIALEVTEYHSQTQEGGTGRPRVEVEVAWWRHLEPVVNSERRTDPSLKKVQVCFRFSDQHLPGKVQSAAVARELVGAVRAVIEDRRFRGRAATVEVDFLPRAIIESNEDSQGDETLFLSTEDWPEIAKRLGSLTVSRYGLEWPSGSCVNATASWIGPEVDEFKRILEEKANKAKKYTVGSLPLWLLIVCETIDDGGELHGDLASHIFPSNEVEQDQLADMLRQTGFDFQTGPFSEVWLFSCLSGKRHRLHPRG